MRRLASSRNGPSPLVHSLRSSLDDGDRVAMVASPVRPAPIRVQAFGGSYIGHDNEHRPTAHSTNTLSSDRPQITRWGRSGTSIESMRRVHRRVSERSLTSRDGVSGTHRIRQTHTA